MCSSDLGGSGFPPCWLFCLRQRNTGAYPCSLVGLMADSGRAHAKEYFPEPPLPVSLSPRETEPAPASAGDPSTLAGRSGSVSPRVIAPSPGSRCAHYSVCALQEWGLWASLVARWLRICLLMRGTRVRALVWEDPTCRGATRPVSHNY